MSEDPLSWDTTEESLIEMEESEGKVAAGVIAAVVVGVLATIALLFSFALLLDCRHKRKIQEKEQKPGRRKTPTKRATFPQFISNSSSNRDNITFVNQMCVDSTTTPPAVVAGRSEEICSGTNVSDTLNLSRSYTSSNPEIQTV